MSLEDHFFRRLENLLVFRQGDRRAPHKPLYLLLCISGIQRKEPRLHSYEDVQDKLKKALRLFGPRTASLHPEYPFWHLQNDGLAELVSEKPLVIRKSSSNPTVTSLRNGNAKGGLVEADYQLLSGNLSLQSLAAHKILDAHFPSSIHEELIRFFGLTLDDPHARDKTTNSEFRERVLSAYQNRCALTGFELAFDGRSVGVEAAHIFWPQSGGNDDVSNGVAMTSLHRKLFHLGLFKVRPDDLRIVVSSRVSDQGTSGLSLSGLDGKSIELPRDKAMHPNTSALSWHAKWVFRG